MVITDPNLQKLASHPEVRELVESPKVRPFIITPALRKSEWWTDRNRRMVYIARETAIIVQKRLKALCRNLNRAPVDFMTDEDLLRLNRLSRESMPGASDLMRSSKTGDDLKRAAELLWNYANATTKTVDTAERMLRKVNAN